MNTQSINLPLLLPVEHEECERCLAEFRSSLLRVKGIVEAKHDPENSTLTLTYDPNLAPMEWIERRAREIGLQLAQNIEHHTLSLTGMDCPDCALSVEKGVSRLPGVVYCSVNFPASKMHLELAGNETSMDQVTRLVRELGYEIETGPPTEEAGLLGVMRREARIILAAISGLLLLTGFAVSFLNVPAGRVLYAMAIVSGGYFAGRAGIAALRTSFSFDMNVLMTVAVIGAVLIDQWPEAATITFLFSLGTTLEAHAAERTRRSIRTLIELFPKEATVRTHGAEMTLPLEGIKVGDTLLVRPGERIALDGVVTHGSSSVDEAPITGESIPAAKEPGDKVYAGTINGRGYLEVKVRRRGDDTTLARIIHLVEQAQAQRAPSQQFVERFAHYYTPTVIASAALIATIPPLVFGLPFETWFYRALTLLVVACPCALVISTPVSIVSALGAAARNGVLIKGGAYLEAAGSVKVIAFDKTGTLTEGRPVVTDVLSLNGASRRRILTLAAAVESRSEHPLAEAILAAAREENVHTLETSEFEALSGLGAKARVDGEVYYVGNPRLFWDMGAPIEPAYEAVLRLQQEGKTAMLLGNQRELLGVIAAADRPRPAAVSALETLRSQGIEKLVMLTGDHDATARAVAEELRLDDYYADLLPEDKVEVVRRLRQRHGNVAVVGDGVNDAPALAASNVGFAMGAAGTDVALETADIALMADDLSSLPYTTHLSRNALRVIKQNVAFSLVIKVSFLALAFPGYLTLWLAVLGDTGASLLVTINGLRLLRTKKPTP